MNEFDDVVLSSDTLEDPVAYNIKLAVYDGVKKAHVTLSNKERDMLLQQLEISLKRYEEEVLQIAVVREYLYHMFNERVTNKLSIAVMARDFNMNIKGHNDQVSDEFTSNMKAAFNYDRSGNSEEAARTLAKARIRYHILYGDELLSLVKFTRHGPNPHSANAVTEMLRIQQYRESLYLSVIKLAAGIGKRMRRGLKGDVVQGVDLVHEAIAAARTAVDNYRPEIAVRGAQPFTSYVYTYVTGMISKFINENTRVVAIPRTILDRYLPVQAVLNENPMLSPYNYEGIAQLVPVTKGQPYTADEVEYLLLSVPRETASLDLEIMDDDDASSPINLGESLLNQERPQEVQIDNAQLKTLLLEVIGDYTNVQEYHIMKLRWGGERVLGLQQTATTYNSRTGWPMNKTKVAQIERHVLKRLRDVVSDDPRLEELMDILRDDATELRTSMVDMREGGETWCNGQKLVR